MNNADCFLQRKNGATAGNTGIKHNRMWKKGGILPVSYDDIIRGMGCSDYKAEERTKC